MLRQNVDPVNQNPGAAEDDVLEAIHGIMHVVRARQFRALRDDASGLTHMESKVLGFFSRRPGATLSELVVHSARDKGQLARLVGGLKERGLLEANADESDRRSQRLQPTAAGTAAHRAVQRKARQLSKVAVAGFSEAQRRQLCEALARVRANLEEGREAA
jgi:DNA-binding MarR family transcriptional regulator